MSSSQVTFFLNGRRVALSDPDPDLLLIDWLRSPQVGLAGPKKPCGQGGCGGCTVILSRWDEGRGEVEHRAVNSCLRPVCALDGLSVTTIEGTGAARKPNPPSLHHAEVYSRHAPAPGVQSARLQAARDAAEDKREAVLAAVKACADGPAEVSATLAPEAEPHPSEVEHEGMNLVAWRLAANNGSQCGYCSVGFVMNMSEFLSSNPRATKREIEQALDGNLCRCTGYRPILTAMKTFASDWTEADEAARMKCVLDDDAASQKPASSIVIPFPEAAKAPPQPVDVTGPRQAWRTPADVAALLAMMREGDPSARRLVSANTSFGIYKEEYEDACVLIDVRGLPELSPPTEIAETALRVAASMTYTDLIALLEAQMEARGEVETGPDGDRLYPVGTALGALHHMAMRTAGRIVRNAATIGGNLMLVLHHIAKGEPFPSDLATALVGVGAEVEHLDARQVDGAPGRSTVEALVAACAADPGLPDALVLLAFHLPAQAGGDLLLPQKTALREVNAHSLVNAASRLSVAGQAVSAAVLVFGGVAPFPWRAGKTEALMRALPLTLASAPALAESIRAETEAELARWRDRMAGLPSEGVPDAYRVQLAVSYVFKTLVNAIVRTGGAVPPDVASVAETAWGRWPVSDGRQSWKSRSFEQPVGVPYIKHMAMDQTSGQVHYAHELAVPPLTVFASLAQSARALADFSWRVPGEETTSVARLRDHLSATFPGFIDIITAQDIPDGGVNLQGMGADQPVFADGTVDYVGQCLALIGADDPQTAERIADYVSASCVTWRERAPRPGEPEWWSRPVLTLEDAIRVGSIFPDWPKRQNFVSHIWRIVRPGSRLDWVQAVEDPLDRESFVRPGTVDGVACRIVGGAQSAGAQIHFYMEPQAAVAELMDDRRMVLRPSTQSPMEMHQTAAMALGAMYNHVQVDVPQVGGGFGGKTEQTRFVVGPTAVAARAMKRPVRLALDRERDTAMIGKRHAYYGQYQVAIDAGETNPDDRGLIRGFDNRMYGDGGAFYDCSFIVSNCIQTRIDNAYRVENFRNQIDVCRTNTAPSTAFRAFGDIQGKIILESAIDDAAFAVGMTAEAVREKNLYQRGDVTPFGQALSFCYIREVWDWLKTEIGYDAKRAEVEAFNAANRWRKRGIAMLPVKYGSGYNLAMLEQATAVISIYQADGTVIIHQGGVEMGQGLLTQMRQVAAYVLNLPMEMIVIEAPRTAVVPNPTSTGGSTGTAYNGEAVRRLCAQMRGRLMEFAQKMLTENGDEWCRAQGIDWWNHGAEGWRAETAAGDGLIWQKLVAMAYANRVGLTAAFTAPIAGGDTPTPAVEYKPHDLQPKIPGYESDPDANGGAFDNFVGFTYSAAASVVEVDVLTGETKILSSDIAYDMGWSLNPAVDIGQVEGAFVQGIGYVLTERLAFQPDGPEAGRLNTLNTWRYKPPAVTTIPLEMNVRLFPRDLVPFPPAPDAGVLSSKEVGEPPLVLATSVFLAVKGAVRASRLERGLPGLFRLDAPCTVDTVREACAVDPASFA
ncbi:molybdopterin-dependent oxidoreductase [Albimonas sp. CAU 1670]|uniref:molybdopterin cofactor-binding domain-containing protein n=1 Tax=Albimonas sp. CAU 1670 TaxID=3032599 RepID=UPI0023DC1A98|nr:molybdopterin cofactor-binding domain-containing protein [Albimonas sp. CAU 1670]MDF2235320.1 molybdopterin-dependent oxidoreductase [Albimonas sp. CAU 1670]